jgi:Na+/proline symporter
MDILDFSFDFDNRYTFWSGIIGGTFLALSYFGTDQSQVQRYLSGRSVKEMQRGLIFNGILKVPMQFFILLIGVMVFVFYQFNSSPLHFNPSAVKEVMASEYASEYQSLEAQKTTLDEVLRKKQITYARAEASSEKEALLGEIIALNNNETSLRTQSKALIKKANPNTETNDKDYVFIHFILNNLPRGLIGLLLAVILSAAMSSTASELNALGSTTAMDLYKRNIQGRSPNHYLKASKWFTLLWGVIAIGIACVANLFDNLIQLVNIIGSIFYGNVLGIFLLAFFIKFVKSRSVFIAAIITQLVIIYFWWIDLMPYLWLNLAGCAIVMAIAILIEALIPSNKK